jgi:hypothetical protein
MGIWEQASDNSGRFHSVRVSLFRRDATLELRALVRVHLGGRGVGVLGKAVKNLRLVGGGNRIRTADPDF